MSVTDAAADLKPQAAATEKPFDADLGTIRRLAGLLPGALPTAVNCARVAASIRPRKFVITGGDETPVLMPRTAFQVVYPDGAVMIDSGLDRATHDTFGAGEPYYQDEFDKLTRALNAARLIVLTHHHADHVAGVVCAPNVRELARKTIISTTLAECMMTTPHKPHLRLDQESIDTFIVLDYAQYYPVAPGMVLIKAPGHSIDHQMVYVRLQSGREILHSVDVAWNLANVMEIKGKAAPWVKEDVGSIIGQLRWLKRVRETERGLSLLITHDDELLAAEMRAGAIGGELSL